MIAGNDAITSIVQPSVRRVRRCLASVQISLPVPFSVPSTLPSATQPVLVTPDVALHCLWYCGDSCLLKGTLATVFVCIMCGSAFCVRFQYSCVRIGLRFPSVRYFPVGRPIPASILGRGAPALRPWGRRRPSNRSASPGGGATHETYTAGYYLYNYLKRATLQSEVCGK